MADNVVPFPRDEDEFDPTAYIRQEQQAQARNVITSIDADPDQAARAQSLSQSTGVPAAVIYGDQENFEKQHKIALTNSILSNNQYLRDYMDSNPMAAKVSNDDIGQLDTISQALQKYGVAGALHKAAMSGPFGGDVATKTAEGFIEGWGDSTFGTWAFNMPGSEKVWWASKALYNIIGIPIEGGARAFTGAVYGAYRGGTELFKQFGMDEQTADRMARDLIGMAEHHIISGQAHMPEIAPELIDKIQAKRLMSYITKGEEPPIGISPMYDTLKIEEAKKDLGDLKEITKEAHASSTRERSPELFGDFIRQHTGNTKISIDASAVRQLYGDKPPELEDGLLGWVPGIKDQLGVAEATGGYIEVPLADWLARVEPEVANQLHDFIRVKPNGMSLEETKFQKEYQSVIDEMVEAFHGTGKDFDTFDTGHIGSGQGAQSYGYGHYLAQERKVAEQYQEQMSRHARAGHDLANSYAFEYEGNKELALQKLERDRTKSKGEKAPWYPDEVYQAAIDALKSGKDLSRPTGNLLKVRINREPHEFLDWDNALPLDHPARAAAVKALEPDTLGKKLSEALEIGLEGGTLRPMARDMILTNKELTGMDLYNQLARRLAKGKGFDDKGASKVLSEAGIAGIKYLDQQSRGKTNSAWWQDNIAHLNEQLKGEEDPHKIAQIKASIGLAENALERMKETGEPTITSNFVVFNDKDLQILERNGKPLSSGDAMTDTIREQGGMHPLFDEERVNKLQLEKVQDVEEPVPSWTTAATGYGTRFDIKDLAGNTAGQLLVFDKGKTLDIGWLGSHERATLARPNVWGPRVVRDLLAQLKEQFPEAETITARRVSGAREVPTEVKINLEAPDEAILRKLAEELDSLFTKKQGDINVTKFPEEALTKSEKELIERVNDLLDKIAPQAEREAVQKMGKEGFVTRGRHTFDPAIASSLIQWSIESPHPLGTARHEAIHHLRTMGMFKPEEWISLEEASRRGDWQERFNIETRYPDQTHEVKIEESIAEAYREWGAGRLEVEGPIAKLFERIKELLKQIAEIYREYTGQLPDAQRLFEKIEKGEIGQREAFSGEMATRVKEAYGLSEEEPTTKMKQTELPQAGTTRIEDRGIFQKGQAIGMTEKQYRRYQELIEKQWKEDIESHLAKYERKERIRQTKEWKENTAEMRKEVEQDTLGRPDVGADEFFRKGMLYGERVPGKIPKIDSSKLTEEQRAAIPEKYQSETGLTPDDVAGLFGYQSGDALIRELGNYETARKESGLEGKAFLDSMIDKLTDQRMEEKYGKLKENIIADAKDQALSQTQLDLIHEEVLALAAKNKAEISLTKDQMVQWLQTEFNKLPVGYVRSDAFLRSANRYGKLAEMGLLKGDFAEAFKAKQGQFNAVFMAKAAAKFEKERESFERQAEFMSRREVPSVDQEYTDWVHDILDRTGQKVKRTRDDLDASIASRSNKTLQDFVEYKTFHDMRELPVSDLILDPKFKKPFDSLSVDEFRQVKDAIKTLVHNGREEMKIYKQGQAADLAVIKTGLIDQLRTFPARYRGTDQGRKLTASRLLNSVLASHLQMEALFNRWDRGDPNGLWTQYVMRDLSTAANEEAILEKSFSRMLKAIGEPKNLNGKLENNLFLDPLMKDAGSSLPMEMTRRNLLAVMLNMGNESNLKKLADGYGLEPARILDWVNQHATKEDWDWVQGMGDVYKEIKKEADKMYRRLTDLAPENIEIKPIQTPHGEYAGWYYPIIYSSDYVGKSEKLMGGNPLEMNGYFRATTNQGYTKRRTGYVSPVSLAMDEAPIRMKQMIHDIAFREAIINASKIFYDNDVLNAITVNYGKEYRELMIPYIRDVANSSNYNSAASVIGSRVLERFRQNMIGTLIGLNPGTVFKHGPTAFVNSLTEVGPINFVRELGTLVRQNDQQATTNWKFAMDKSAELQRRTRHYNETLGGAHDSISGDLTWREALIRAGATPVALSDLLSAVPTWLAKYKDMIKDGADEGTAVYEADRAVRRAHGSTAITNRAQIARGGAGMQWLTSLYGFFSHILNRQYELAWRAHDTIGKFKEGEFKEGAKDVPKLTAMLFSYVIFPALVEETVSGGGDPKEGWLHWSAKAMAHGLSSSWIVARDVAHAFMYNKDPSVGLLSTYLHTINDTLKDFPRGKEAFSKQNAGRTLQHSITTFGALTGYTNAQEGRTAKGIYNYATGQEKPRDLGQWWKLLRYGQTKEFRH